MARTRIVATLGPASRDEATIAALAEAGVSVFRLNFSHGTQAEHGDAIATIRRVTRGREVAILAAAGTGTRRDLRGSRPFGAGKSEPAGD